MQQEEIALRNPEKDEIASGDSGCGGRRTSPVCSVCGELKCAAGSTVPLTQQRIGILLPLRPFYQAHFRFATVGPLHFITPPHSSRRIE
jgi:hypothetical protein